MTGFAAVCMFVYLLIASTAEAAFVNSIVIPIAIWLGCLFAQKNFVEEVDRNVSG